MTRILLVAHQGLASAMLNVASTILGPSVEPDAAAFDVGSDDDPAELQRELARWIEAHRAQSPLLLLTDLSGATPHNLAVRAAPSSVPVVAGLNLGMLLRALNHADHPPAELAERAMVGGQRSILRVGEE